VGAALGAGPARAASAERASDRRSVETALATFGPGEWQPLVAEERPRAVAGTGVDAVIRARRR
jgi:hypothetical protein